LRRPHTRDYGAPTPNNFSAARPYSVFRYPV
jgi:hypothetical protein